MKLRIVAEPEQLYQLETEEPVRKDAHVQCRSNSMSLQEVCVIFTLNCDHIFGILEIVIKI